MILRSLVFFYFSVSFSSYLYLFLHYSRCPCSLFISSSVLLLSFSFPVLFYVIPLLFEPLVLLRASSVKMYDRRRDSQTILRLLPAWDNCEKSRTGTEAPSGFRMFDPVYVVNDVPGRRTLLLRRPFRRRLNL